jgi:hypothetical protein
MCRSLARHKESRKRNSAFLYLRIPSLHPVRLLGNDGSFVTLQDIYERQRVSLSVTRAEPLIQSSLKIQSVVARQGVESQDIPVIGKELTFWSLERIDLLNLIELKRRDCHEICTKKHRDGERHIVDLEFEEEMIPPLPLPLPPLQESRDVGNAAELQAENIVPAGQEREPEQDTGIRQSDCTRRGSSNLWGHLSYVYQMVWSSSWSTAKTNGCPSNPTTGRSMGGSTAETPPPISL